MLDLTRRQVGVGALSILATTTMPVSIARLLTMLDAGEAFDQQLADWIREIKELHANFVWASRDYLVDESARQEWWLCHHDLASHTDMLRKDVLGGHHHKRLIYDWLDSLYPRPAVRALRVSSSLRLLSRGFAERQSYLDDITAELGEAEHQIWQFRQSRPHLSLHDQRYVDLCRGADRFARRQQEIAGSFVHLEVETKDDMSALSQAASTHYGCRAVSKLNARRRHTRRTGVRHS